MKAPTVLDQQDRRLLGMVLVLALAAVLALVGIAGALGLAVRVFTWAAWGG